jgi:hypothetical protein
MSVARTEATEREQRGQQLVGVSGVALWGLGDCRLCRTIKAKLGVGVRGHIEVKGQVLRLLVKKLKNRMLRS